MSYRCKKLMKALGVIAKDFALKCVNTRRYPTEVYSWYHVIYQGIDTDSYDPNCGKMNVDIKYSFIFEAIFKLAPKLNDYIEKNGGGNHWIWIENMGEEHHAPMKEIWSKGVRNSSLAQKLFDDDKVTFLYKGARHFIEWSVCDAGWMIYMHPVSEVLEDRFERELITDLKDLKDEYEDHCDVIDGGLCTGSALDAVEFFQN